MLSCNGVVVNTANPTTEVDKYVAKRFKEIAKEYGLEGKKRIRFRYPKSAIKPDKDNPGRFHKPASYQIKFDAIKRTDAGIESWRYFVYETKLPGGKVRYQPTGYNFTGAWELGTDDIEIIFFMLDIYSRNTTGANYSAKNFPMLEVEDIEAETKARVEAKRSRVSIEAKLYLPEDEGGYSEEQLRNAAATLFIPGFETEDIDIVRDMLDAKIKASGDTAMKAFKRNVKNPETESNKLAQSLIDRGIVKVGQVTPGSKETAWIEVKEDGTKRIIVVIPAKGGNTKEKVSILAKFLLSSVEISEELSARLVEPEGDTE